MPPMIEIQQAESLAFLCGDHDTITAWWVLCEFVGGTREKRPLERSWIAEPK